MALDPLTAVLDIGGKIIDRLWPDPAQRDAARLELFKAQQAGEFEEARQVFELAKAQAATNSVEAAHPNTFVSGWRPFIGWTCGAAFAYKFVLAPALAFGLAMAGKPLQLPPVDLADMMPVLIGMLGLGAMRSWEKGKGVAAS